MLKELTFHVCSVEEPRMETLEDKEYAVFPVVMLVEGVHNQLLYTSEELSKYPVTWNGVPIPISHPKDKDGNYCTANSPEILEKDVVGRIFNTMWDSSSNKLKAEAWVDVSKANKICPTLMENIGNNMEISTGLFCDTYEKNGVWKGEAYYAEVVNIRPDHLALLPNQTGACSYADGCGIRANASCSCVVDNPEITDNFSHNSKEASGAIKAHLAAHRKALGITDNNMKGGPMEGDEKGLKHFLVDLFRKALGPRSAALQNYEEIVDASLSDRDLRQAIYSALEKVVKGSVYIADVYTSEQFFVYELSSQTPDGTYISKLYKRGFILDDSGTVTLSDDAVEVKPKVEYVAAVAEASPIKDNKNDRKEIMNMCENGKICPARVKALIASGMFKEHQTEFLSNLDVAQIEALEKAAGITHNHDPEQQKSEKVPDNNSSKTVEQYIADAPADIKEAIMEAMKVKTNKRQALIESILKAEGNTFSNEELSARSDSELGKISALVSKGDVNFTGKVPGADGKLEAKIDTNRKVDGNGVPPVPNLREAIANQAKK